MKEQRVGDRGGLLFVVSAPSGAGKTSLCREVSRTMPNIRHSVSHTTRQPRPGETHGKDYYFISPSEFQEMIRNDEFLEWAEVHDHLYGTSHRAIREQKARGLDVVLDIDCQGAMQLKKKQVEGIYIYILPPSFEALKARLQERRSDSPEAISKRLRKAREEIASFREYDYLIVNDDFIKAQGELQAVISAERIKIKRADLSWVEREFIERPGSEPT